MERGPAIPPYRLRMAAGGGNLIGVVQVAEGRVRRPIDEGKTE